MNMDNLVHVPRSDSVLRLHCGATKIVREQSRLLTKRAKRKETCGTNPKLCTDVIQDGSCAGTCDTLPLADMDMHNDRSTHTCLKGRVVYAKQGGEDTILRILRAKTP